MTTTLSADDRLAILDLFARYAWAYDAGDHEAYAAVFTKDGVLADENGVLGTGREGIKQALQIFIDHRGGSVWRHFNDHYLFTGSEGGASVRSYWMVTSVNADGAASVLGTGTYLTDVRKLGDEWLIARRTFWIDRPA